MTEASKESPCEECSAGFVFENYEAAYLDWLCPNCYWVTRHYSDDNRIEKIKWFK